MHEASYREKWRAAWQSRRFVVAFVLTGLFLGGALLTLNGYLQFNEMRQGVILIDPVLAMLPSMDFSLTLFLLIYGSLLGVIASLTRRPRLLLVGLQAYGLLALVRLVMMYSIPLEPPPGLVVLVDPFVGAFSDGAPPLEKDLFFSGHTSSTFLCFVAERDPRLKLLFFFACICVAVLILLQHAHYTVDVLVAPFMAAGAYQLAQWANDRLLLPEQGSEPWY